METNLREEFKTHCESHGVYTYPVPVPRLDKLGECLSEAARLAEWNAGDCYCVDSGDQRLCSYCELREQAKKILACLEVEHRTLHPDRLGSESEEIYLRNWQKQQERNPGLNHGFGLLELILRPLRQDTVRHSVWGRKFGFVPPVSQRDAEVAATVIQWLGTACGRGFISDCENAIEQARKTRNWQRHCIQQQLYRHSIVPESQEYDIATTIASRYFQPGTTKFEELQKEICVTLTERDKTVISDR